MHHEHLQEFAKINLAKLVIWQHVKIYAKLKRRLSPRVCYFGLGKMRKEGPQEHNLCNWAPGSFWAIANGSLAGVQGRGGHGRPKSGDEGPRRRGRTGGRGTDFGV